MSSARGHCRLDRVAPFDGADRLEPGATRTFELLYGAAPSESIALASLQAVGAEAYSLGEPTNAGGPDLGQPVTFFFGYKG